MLITARRNMAAFKNGSTLSMFSRSRSSVKNRPTPSDVARHRKFDIRPSKPEVVKPTNGDDRKQIPTPKYVSEVAMLDKSKPTLADVDRSGVITISGLRLGHLGIRYRQVSDIVDIFFIELGDLENI